MNDRPKHTDRQALERHRSRARVRDADFAHTAAIDELQFRLGMVNRTFSAPLLIGPELPGWREALPAEARHIDDDETLAVEAGQHDLVVHAMSLHWSNDIVGQLIQSRKALQPDGLFIGVMFGGETLHELRSAMSEAEIALHGGLSPRVAMMAEIRDLGSLMQRAGFALPVVDKIELKVSYETIFHLIADLRRMGETNALSMRKKGFEKKELFALADELYRTHFPGAESRIIATFDVLFLTGWSPHESQQKPLRPGTAKARLADALKTDEVNLNDRPGEIQGKEDTE